MKNTSNTKNQSSTPTNSRNGTTQDYDQQTLSPAESFLKLNSMASISNRNNPAHSKLTDADISKVAYQIHNKVGQFTQNDIIIEESLVLFKNLRGKDICSAIIIELIKLNVISNRCVLRFFGELGSGKTEFAKNIITKITKTTKVPSPTFLLAQVYDISKEINSKIKSVSHFDFYKSVTDMSDALENGISIVEWPENKSNWRDDLYFIDMYFDYQFFIPNPYEYNLYISKIKTRLEELKHSSITENTTTYTQNIFQESYSVIAKHNIIHDIVVAYSNIEHTNIDK